ncbi:MAG: flagellar biosynthetic protein FliO [bacterium]
MKSNFYMLALILAGALQLAAADTNASVTTAICSDSTNRNQSEACAAKPGSTNTAPEALPWSLSATETDDKFKDLSGGLGKSSGNGPSLLRSLGATIAVLGLLFGVNYWLRKRSGRFTGAIKSARLQIVERVAIDHRRGILLIEVDGERIVAAVSADRIEPLAVLPSKPRQRETMP